MNRLKKILKGDLGLTVEFAMDHVGLVITPIEAEKFKDMLLGVYNSGRKGFIDPNAKENFEEFYKLYPRKVSKKDAERAYMAAIKEVDHDTIMDALRAQLPELMVKYNTDKGYVKHPATWLSKGCWDDETSTKAAPSAQIMTDDKIFNSKGGQYALEKGLAYPLKIFVARHNRMPSKDEFRAIMDDPTSKSKFKMSESRKLETMYLKG